MSLIPAASGLAAALLWLGPATGSLGPVGLDLEHYLEVANAIWAGGLPYGDVALEYPPLSLLPITAARVFADDPGGYREAFALINGALVVTTAVASALAARRLGQPPVVQAAAGALVAIGPVVLGGVLVAERLDALPTCFVALAALAAAAGRERTTGAALGLGAAAKLWPGPLIFPFAALAARRGGRQALVACLVGFAVALAVPFALAAAFSIDGLADSISYQAERPLQIEAAGATLLLGLDGLGLTGPYGWSSGFGSINLEGGASVGVVTAITSVLGAAATIAICAISVIRVRDARTELGAAETAFAAALALTAALILFGKVLSPQFMLWLLPLPLLIGRYRWVAAGLVLSALALTRVAIGDDYFAYALRFEALPVTLFAIRDLALAALLATACLALRRRGA